jgi:hypothetical protein
MLRPVRAAIVAAHEALHPFDIADRSFGDSFGFPLPRLKDVPHPYPHYKCLSFTVKLIAIRRISAFFSLLHHRGIGDCGAASRLFTN